MSAQLDPVTLEVVRNALPAVANEMAADLQRTSYNMMIYEVRDFCAALVDVKGRLISQNVAAYRTSSRSRRHHRGCCCTLRCRWVCPRRRADHQPPAGGRSASQQHRDLRAVLLRGAADLLLDGAGALDRRRRHEHRVRRRRYGARSWLEGLQLDQLKIYQAGKLDEQLHRVIRDNIRFPESSLGDMRSQIAACRLAVRQLDELFTKYGSQTMLLAIDRIFARPRRSAARSSPRFPMESTRRSRSMTTTASR